MDADDAPNPYQSPRDMSGELAGGVDPLTCGYGDLPRSCPRCDRKFSEILYKKLYPRRFRVGTLAYFAAVGLASFLVMAFLGGAAWIFFVFVTGPMVMFGLRFKRSVRVYCKACGWSQKYLVTGHS